MDCFRRIARENICTVIAEAITAPEGSGAEPIQFVVFHPRKHGSLYHLHFVERALLCFAVVLVVGVGTHAELIVEIHNSGNCFDCPPSGANFGLAAVIPAPPGSPQTQADWSIFATPADLGRTFAMPADLVPSFGPILTHPGSIYISLSCCGDVGVHGFGTPPLLNEGSTRPDIVTVTRVAPNLGPNLAGYRVTDINQTIDEIMYTQVGSNLYRGSAAHTIRIYGVPIPEPATWVLAFSCVLFCCQLRVRVPSCQLSPVAGG